MKKLKYDDLLSSPTALASPEEIARVSDFRRVMRLLLKRWVVVIGLVVILGVIIAAVFAGQLAPYNPYERNLPDRLLSPSWEHPLGTDSLGRDTLSRLIYGSRTALAVGVVAIGLAAIIGMTMGMIASYFGGVVYAIIMRLTDALMAFPLILKALVLAVLLGGGLNNVMLAIGISLSSTYCRLMSGLVLSVKENDYVLAARASASGNLRIMLRHILPNCFPPLIVLITLNMGGAILAEAGLSYLGVGINPPGAAWGAMVNDGYRYLLSNPILGLSPGVAIMLVVYAFNIVGDGLRDALDPRLRGTL